MLKTATACGVLILAAQASAQSIELKEIEATRLDMRPNLAARTDFEAPPAGRVPDGWNWESRNTDSTCTLDPKQPHSGRQSLRLTNGTPFGPHVYAMLWAAQPVNVEPGKPHTLSVYVRSKDPGIAWVGGGANWQYRLRFPRTGDEWRRVHLTFTPAPADNPFTLRICSESPTAGVWLDDIKIEAGETPTPCAASGSAAVVEPLLHQQDVDGDGPFTASYDVVVPAVMPEALLRAELAGAAQAAEKRCALEAGAWRLQVKGEAAGLDDKPRELALRLSGGGPKPVAAKSTLRFYSSSGAALRLEALAPRIDAAGKALAAIRGQDASYPQVSMSVLNDFPAFIREDLQHNEVRRALEQIADLEQIVARLDTQVADVIAGKRKLDAVPRWTGRQRARIDGPSFLAPVAYPDGRSLPGYPVFFSGYGHFGKAQADLEKLPGYGANIIQCEFGPSSIFPAEGQTSDAAVQHVKSLLDRGQKAGVAVCLLVSPHYLPEWMRTRYPHLNRRREGFLNYCLHAPEGREMLKKYLEIAIPPIKDHPALHSICLSNEPINMEEPCEFARREWHAWLRGRHGDIATLNARWGTQLARLEDAALPDPYQPEAGPRGAWHDYIRFNQEWFAGWHAAMAETIRKIDPGLPIHAKAMAWTLVNDGDVRFGVDAELFGAFSDINGNDAVTFYNHEPTEFAQGWQTTAMAYDLQRSVKDAPVCNTENHIIVDRETRRIPPEQVRSALWQQAIHGQSASTVWVWERTFDPRSDFAGSILHRPACVEIAGHTGLDLCRLAPEVTAFQRLKPDAVILHSVSGLAWDGGHYTDCMGKLYTALAFSGVKVGFVTERRLERGELPAAAVLFVPNLVHLSDAAFASLAKFAGKTVVLGDDATLRRNEYDRERPDAFQAERLPIEYGKTTWSQLRETLRPRLESWKIKPAVSVTTSSGKLPPAVEWLCVRTDAGWLVNLCNYGREPVDLSLRLNARKASGEDLLTHEPAPGATRLGSLQTRLIRLQPD